MAVKTKIFAAFMSVFLLHSTGLAQGYSIRITYNTNLRESYSLESAIVETAPAGTTLAVVGSNKPLAADQPKWQRGLDGGLGWLYPR